MEKNMIFPVGETEGNAILIVDDDPINRAILRKIFSHTYAIVEAANGRDGLMEILDPKNHFSAVLLDVIMPEMIGVEVLKRLKPLGILEKLPVFLITAESNDQVV